MDIRTGFEPRRSWRLHFYASEGSRLDKDAIITKVAKWCMKILCLNSMLGKLTER